jgi:hypothetical protein
MILGGLPHGASMKKPRRPQEKPGIDAFETIMRHKQIITGKLDESFCLLFSAVYEESGTARA